MHTETRSGSSEPTRSKHFKTVVQLRSMLVAHLPLQMEYLSRLLDDRLFHRCGAHDALDFRSETFMTMRLLMRESEALKHSYQATLLKEFDRCFGWQDIQQVGSSPGKSVSTSRSLSLVAKEDLEEDLAISGMAEKGCQLFAKSLTDLSPRIAVLAGHDRARDRENPISPQAFCRAFAEALRPLPLDVPTKLLIYKLYDQALLQGLGDFYAEVEQFLHDIVPIPETASEQRTSHEHEGSPFANQRSAVAGDSRSIWRPGNSGSRDSLTDFFEELQKFLHAWRGRSGIPAKMFDSPEIPAEDVMAALHKLQRSSRLAVSVAGEPLKNQLCVYFAANSDARRSLARREEDVIDMVAMLFDFILEEPYLPDAVKLFLARLQIPVVKVAIMEQAFFARKNHPARLLLNALAQAGIGLELDQGGRDRSVLKAIEQAVERVLNDFERNSTLFSNVLDEFMLFMERDAQRSRMVEERTRQSSRSKEQLLLSKRRVAQEIALRVRATELPLPLRSFLFDQWKDVMLLAYLRRDRSTRDWERSLAVVDGLIESIHGPAVVSPESMPAWFSCNDELLQAVRTGLESVSRDPVQVRATLEELESWLEGKHRLAAWDIREIGSLGAVTDQQGELLQLEGLSDPYAGSTTLEGIDETVPVPAEALATASDVAPGDWIEFRQTERRVQGKLCWKSQISDTLVFVNRKGAKVMELSVRELAHGFAEKTARRLDAVAAPLMDRAVDALLMTLRGTETGSLALRSS